MGSGNEETWSGFSVDPKLAAMLWAVYSQDVFIPRKRSMKATVNIKSANLQAATQALIDSGATDNFISPVLSNRHKLPAYQLDKPKVVRNVDSTPNSIGKVTHVTNLTIEYNDTCAELRFLIIDLGGDDMILGYPFLELTNPIINWSTGEFPGEVTVQTKDAYKWTPERQLNYLDKMNVDNFISSKEEGYDHDPNFIPSNERGIIKNANYFTRKVTMATELAIEDHQQRNQPYEYIDPITQRYYQAKAEGYKSPLGLHSQYYHDELKKAEEYKKKGYLLPRQIL